MDWIGLAAEIVKAVAWPVTALILARWFRQPLTELLTRLKRLKRGDLEADFSEGIQEVRARLPLPPASPAAPPTLPPDSSSPAPTPQIGALAGAAAFALTGHGELSPDVGRLITEAPAEAVQREWAKIEGSVVLFVAQGLAPSGLVSSVLDHLVQSKIIDDSTRDSIVGLRHLRNLAAHSSEQLTPKQARDFVDMAEATLWTLGGALKKATAAKK